MISLLIRPDLLDYSSDTRSAGYAFCPGGYNVLLAKGGRNFSDTIFNGDKQRLNNFLEVWTFLKNVPLF